MALCMFACVSMRSRAQDANAPGSSPCEGGLSLHISAPKTVFDVSRSVPLRVEIQNCGQKELWIALSYEGNIGFPANMPLIIRDHHRRRVAPNNLLVGGFPKVPFEWWVRLSLGYLYGRDVLVTRYESKFVNTPGKYEITVSYTGIGHPQRPSKPPPESANAPAQSSNVFTGHVESNSIWVEIREPTGDNR